FLPCKQASQAVRIPNEIERAVRPPYGLKARTSIPAGYGGRLAGRAILRNVNDVELSRIPGHGGEVPGEKGEPASIGAQSRACVETVPRQQPGRRGVRHLSGRNRPKSVFRQRRILQAMGLANADQSFPAAIESEVRKASGRQICKAANARSACGCV